MTSLKGRPLHCALIGTGMVSGTYVAALDDLKEKVSLNAVVARSTGSVEAFLDRHSDQIFGPVESFVSVETLVKSGRPDFAIVATPPNARLEVCMGLVEARIPTLMEKPVERSLKNAKRLVEMYEKASLPLGVVLQHRARPLARTLLSRIESDDFGALRLVEIKVPWWRPQTYYDEPGRGTYERDGGGVMISQAIHTLDLALQLTGPVSAVSAMSATTGFHRMEAEDFVAAGLEFASGAFGSFVASTASYPGCGEEIILHYTDASVTLTANELTIHWQDGREEKNGTAASSGAGADPMAFTSDWHRMVIEDFCSTVSDGTAPMASGRSALDVHRLIDTLERSAGLGKRVEIEPGEKDES